MKRTVSLFVAVFMILTLVGCSKYHSKYKAVGFVHSNDLSSAYMNFYTFEGRMVFKLKSSGEGDLKYSAKLESGSATVYYDYLGTKSKLFSVSGGEELASYGGYVDTGTVYIIVETDGECRNGVFQFNLD